MNASSTICGIDYGTRRIGLAVGDLDRRIASPLTTLTISGDLDARVRVVIDAASDFDVTEWVVGLPLNMDDTEGPQAKTTRNFGQRLEEISGRKVHFWDERLSSLTADEYLIEAELTRKKKKARRDRVAAQVILQSFLDAQEPQQTG